MTIPPTSPTERKKVALVHDFLISSGGAERVFQAIAELYPEAPIYTLLYDAERLGQRFSGHEIRVSWLAKLPRFLRKRYRLLLPFFPVAVESFDLRDFDLVISSSGAWSKGVVTRLHTKHIAYLHSPMRYAWDYHEEYLGELGARGLVNVLTRILLSYLRVWDRQAAERPDEILTNSRFTQARVQKYYRRQSAVLYPPVVLHEGPASRLAPRGDEAVTRNRKHFLVVSRLTRSKKIHLVIEAFEKLGLPLVIVGVGPERAALERAAGQTMYFTGFVSDARLAELYQEARAVIFPSEEDFGMVAAEALAFGTPVIAYEYGGIREILTPGQTGETFHAQTPEIIAEGVRRFLAREGQYDTRAMRQSVASLTRENFQQGIRQAVERVETKAGEDKVPWKH